MSQNIQKGGAIYYSGSGTRRGRDLAAALELPYVPSNVITMKPGNSGLGKALLYTKVIFQDTWAILRSRFKLVIFEHAGDKLPTIVAYLSSGVFRKKLIVDCHTGVYQREKGIKKSILFFSDKVIKSAFLFIAHNEETLRLKDLHENMIVLESRVPAVNQDIVRTELSDNKKRIVFITRFHSDEPIEEMIQSTKLFTDDYHFYFTGNYEWSVSSDVIQECGNVTFTGFIPRKEYENLLNRSDVLVALTKRDYTLLYAGREAIAFEKPLVVSNNETCKNYFSKGTVFVENSPEGIADGVLGVLDRKDQLSHDMTILKIEKDGLWNKRLLVLKRKMAEVIPGV